MTYRNPLDKHVNKACKDLKMMLYDHKNKTTAEFIEKIKNSEYDEDLLRIYIVDVFKKTN